MSITNLQLLYSPSGSDLITVLGRGHQRNLHMRNCPTPLAGISCHVYHTGL